MAEDEDLVWSSTNGIVTLDGHIVMSMPLREGAVPGRTHTATCTLCRDKQIAAGRKPGNHLGLVGFFKSSDHRTLAVKTHVARHKKHGEKVHIVNLPARIPPATQEEIDG